MRPIETKLRHFVRNESGATSIEYAMIASGVAVAIAAVVMGVGTSVKTMFQGAADGFK